MMKQHFLKPILLSVFVLLLFNARPSFAQGDTLYVDGRYLYTAAGEKVIMRGVNEMFVWNSDKKGVRLLPEISQSGSNTVRLVWTHQYGRPSELIDLIENTIGYKMIAVPECHDATGKWDDDLRACINFWNDPVLIEGIQRNRRWTILNIANEAGNGSISDQMYLDMYKPAIDSLRSWGYTVPIMIDGSIWGQHIDQIGRTAQEILNHDPLKNVIFSTHSYWPRNASVENYHKVVDLSEDLDVCIIVGEGPSITRSGECEDPNPLPYLEGMKILHEGESGWLNWSWGGQKNGDCDDYRYFDFTVDGEFGNWQTVPGSMTVALDTFSIMRTSERPASFYDQGMIDVSGVYLHASKDTIQVGDEVSLDVLVAPINASNQSYTITNDNTTGLISFDEETNSVEALAEGTVTFTVTMEDGGWEADFTLVIEEMVMGITDQQLVFTASPNPIGANDLKVRLQGRSSGELLFHSLTGQKIFSRTFADSDTVVVANSQIPEGMFILQLIVDNERQIVKLHGR